MSETDSTLSQEYLKQKIHYDPETGKFTWICRTRGVKIFSEAGNITKFGYRVIMIDGKNHFAHRLAWLYVYGSWPENFIDHINRGKDDNRICNLRDVNKSENAQNIYRPQSHNKTGYRGVCKHGKNGWRACIGVMGKQINIGTYRSPELAYEAYVEAKKKYHISSTT